MILKIFSRGKSRGEGPINYLLSEKFLSDGVIRNGASVLSGDAFITQELINSSNFSKRYTAGVLSFEERPDQISDAIKQKIMQDFERVMFPGMQPDRYNMLWVEHTDKEHPKTKAPRLELNFLIPTTELYTGKRLQPYYHRQDANYFRAWQTLVNERFGFSDPDDPSHFRYTNIFDSNQSPEKNHEKIKARIAEFLEKKLLQGIIENRDDVIFQLERMAGESIKVTRCSEKFISVVSGDNKKPIRLKGFLFEKAFSYKDFQQRLRKVNEQASVAKNIETHASKQRRIKKALDDFSNIYVHKHQQNIKKYGIPDDEIAWVRQYHCPYDIANPDNIMAKFTAKKDPDDWLDEDKIPAVSTTNAVSDSSNPSDYHPSDDEIALANAKKKAKETAEAQRRLEEERLQQGRQQKQDADARRLMPVYKDIKTALGYCDYSDTDSYDLGYKPLKNLIKDNFIKTVWQQDSTYVDTVNLSVGRFANIFRVTRDGRVGLDYSAYSNVSQLTFFYSSDLFEIQDSRLYIKHTDNYYELKHFHESERKLLEESIANSQKEKLSIWSKPRGLEDAFISYQAHVTSIPDYSLDDDMDEDATRARVKNDMPSTPSFDDDGPGF